MSLVFPSSPVDEEISVQDNGVTYQYNLALNRWDASVVPQVPAILGKFNVITSNQTFIPSPQTVAMKIICTGGGGGGGGQQSSSGDGSTSRGGCGGATASKYVGHGEVESSYALVVGAGGAGGGSGNNTGTDGGVSSVTAVLFTLSCAAAQAGQGGSSGTNQNREGNTGPNASGGDINIQGGDSKSGGVMSSRATGSNDSGGSYWGDGVNCRLSASDGRNPNNFGVGGGGTSNSTDSANSAGGAGGAGVVVIEEYFATPVKGIQIQPGMTIQVANFQTGILATGTTIIPQDNTIPQITEGDEFMSLAFTPKFANSKLLIQVTTHGSHTSLTRPRHIVALFKDAIVNALAASLTRIGEDRQNIESTQTFSHTEIAGTVDLRTYRVRIGSDLAGTYTFNGNTSATQQLGGVMASSITITEIAQ